MTYYHPILRRLYEQLPIAQALRLHFAMRDKRVAITPELRATMRAALAKAGYRL